VHVTANHPSLPSRSVPRHHRRCAAFRFTNPFTMQHAATAARTQRNRHRTVTILTRFDRARCMCNDGCRSLEPAYPTRHPVPLHYSWTIVIIHDLHLERTSSSPGWGPGHCSAAPTRSKNEASATGARRSRPRRAGVGELGVTFAVDFARWRVTSSIAAVVGETIAQWIARVRMNTVAGGRSKVSLPAEAGS
jgi:hypothetical protein